MARQLTVKTTKVHRWMQYEVRGLTPKDLDELKSMEYLDAKDKIIEILDDNVDGFGTVLSCVYGIALIQYTEKAILIKTNQMVRR